MLLSWLKRLFRRRCIKSIELTVHRAVVADRQVKKIVEKKPIRAKFKPKTRYEKKLWREDARIEDED